MIQYVTRTASVAAVALVTVLSCSDPVDPEVSSLTVTPDVGLAVGLNGSVAFTATARDGDGRAISNPQVTWSSSDASIATIDGTGIATGLAEGETTISATSGGATATARLEVYIPPVVADYEPGESYFGRNGYVEYIPGRLPVVLSAAHGGDRRPSEIDDRRFGVTGADRNTAQLTLAIRDAFIAQTGFAPHVVISHLHRVKLDPNREIVEAAQGNVFAEQAWAEFQGYVTLARSALVTEWGSGMYFDLHGHGHPINRLELGYLLSSDVLNRTDAQLNSLDIVTMTSIREIGRTRAATFADVLRGPLSLGGLLEDEGIPSVPSPSDPSPGANPYFQGGYNTRVHGSLDDSEQVSGIQIEHHFPGIRDTDANRRDYAERLARAIRLYVLEYFGFFEPSP